MKLQNFLHTKNLMSKIIRFVCIIHSNYHMNSYYLNILLYLFEKYKKLFNLSRWVDVLWTTWRSVSPPARNITVKTKRIFYGKYFCLNSFCSRPFQINDSWLKCRQTSNLIWRNSIPSNLSWRSSTDACSDEKKWPMQSPSRVTFCVDTLRLSFIFIQSHFHSNNVHVSLIFFIDCIYCVEIFNIKMSDLSNNPRISIIIFHVDPLWKKIKLWILVMVSIWIILTEFTSLLSKLHSNYPCSLRTYFQIQETK